MRCKIIWSLWASPCQLSEAARKFSSLCAPLCVFSTTKVSSSSCRRCHLISGKSLSWHLCCTESTRRLSFFFRRHLISQRSNAPFVLQRVHRQKSLCIQFSACDWGSRGGHLKDVLWEPEQVQRPTVGNHLKSKAQERWILIVYFFIHIKSVLVTCSALTISTEFMDQIHKWVNKWYLQMKEIVQWLSISSSCELSSLMPLAPWHHKRFRSQSWKTTKIIITYHQCVLYFQLTYKMERFPYQLDLFNVSV